MKNSKKHFSSASQNTTEVKKSQKHDANLQKNSSLYFQIGLILCLLGTYAGFEMQFQSQKLVIDPPEPIDIAIIDVFDKFRVEPDILPEKKLKQIKKTVLTDKIIEKPNDFVIKNVVDIIVSDPKPVIDKPVDVGDVDVIDAPIDEIIVPFISIEKVPVYPGCEKQKTNEKRKKCMSEKISRLINRKFNGDLASTYGLSGKQRISTVFTIDKNGVVTDVKIRAPHPALEKEARRVINKIPEMQPGLQRNVPVGVAYTLPIVFQVKD